MLEIISPGGFERSFAEVAPLFAVEGPADFAGIAQVQARYGMTMDFESVPRLIEEHGLAAPGTP